MSGGAIGFDLSPEDFADQIVDLAAVEIFGIGNAQGAEVYFWQLRKRIRGLSGSSKGR